MKIEKWYLHEISRFHEQVQLWGGEGEGEGKGGSILWGVCKKQRGKTIENTIKRK